MSRNDFKNPLIQSGLILIGVFLLIAVVVSSPASGFFSGIFAIVVAIFKGVLFLVGLSIALVCSIAVLIGIFLLATYFYSAEKARYFYSQIKDQCIALYCSIRSCKDEEQEEETEVAAEESPSYATSQPQKKRAEPRVVESQSTISVIETRLRTLEKNNEELKTELKTANGLISSLSESIEGIKESMASSLNPENEQEVEVSPNRLGELETKLNQISDRVEQTEKSADEEIQAVREELSELKSQCSAPEMISGILSYIDSPEDREKLTKTAEEAVSRGMTYSQADELFKKNLPAKIYKTLNSHPRLTKDFIRSIKKKFA